MDETFGDAHTDESEW